MVIESLYIAVD